MTHISHNAEGLHVADIIAELSKFDPRDRTNVECINQRGLRVELWSTLTAELHETSLRLNGKREELNSIEERLRMNRDQLKQLFKEERAARAILARKKKLFRSKTNSLPLP